MVKRMIKNASRYWIKVRDVAEDSQNKVMKSWICVTPASALSDRTLYGW